jgi:ribosomal protein S27AE
MVVREKEALPSLRFCPRLGEPVVEGPGDHVYVCGMCGGVLARGPGGMSLPGAVRCPGCGAWNVATSASP